MNKLLLLLEKGDLRTTGKSNQIVNEVLKDNHLFNELFEGLTVDNPGIRMRTADALEKISSQKPELLQSYKDKLIKISKIMTQQEVQWHIAQMFSYLKLDPQEIKEIIKVLEHYFFSTKSNIVKVMSLQSMVDLSHQDTSIQPHIKKIVKEAANSNSPSVKSRAKKLLKLLE